MIELKKSLQASCLNSVRSLYPLKNKKRFTYSLRTYYILRQKGCGMYLVWQQK